MSTSVRWGFLGCLLFVVVFAGGVLAGAVLDDPARNLLRSFRSEEPAPGPDEALIEEAWQLIDEYYVDRSALETEALTYGAIGGMVAALGDEGHTTFLTPELVAAQHSQIEGEFEGIGAYIEMQDGMPVIVSAIDGSPAKEAGLESGDVIVSVDGEEVIGWTVTEVVNRVKGPAGSEVELGVLDPDTGETRTLTITRARIEVVNVNWQMLPGTQTAQVRIVSFSDGVTGDLVDVLQQVQEQGAESLILDLRSNPGGLLDEAIGVASQFLTEGNVMLMQDAQGRQVPLEVESGAVAPEIPMVVLVDRGSASASEIVAGALKDAGRATLVGETTFGTGTVLSEFPLSDGSSLLLATQEWLTPNGDSFWHTGIAPDVEVSLPEEAEPILPGNGTELTAESLQSSTDTQVLRALEILQGEPVGSRE